MPPRKLQSGYIAVLFAAILSLGLALAIGTVVAQLKKSGALNRSFLPGSNTTQQDELLADRGALLAWYQNNAYALDSNPGQPDLAQALSQANVQLNGAAVGASDLVVSNGVGYHVFAFWFPVPGATGAGLVCQSTQNSICTSVAFNPGTLNGALANTPYILASGFAIESLFVQQTRTNMYRIADLLVNYFDDQNANDADASVGNNWFCDPGITAALPCYGTEDVPPTSATPVDQTAVPISQTVLQSMIGLSATDTITAWDPDTFITVNSYVPPPPPGVTLLPPYTVRLNTVLPWGVPLTVNAVSE